MAKEIVVIVGLILSILGLVGIISIGYISFKIRKDESQSSFDKTKNKSNFEIDEEYDLTVQGVDLESKKIIIMDDFSHNSSVDSTDIDSSDENIRKKQQRLCK